ncbi:hypothetical protein [Streptomyces sp. NPDC023838]|uniref:AMIN-like domain-containing (lipo)protein n=1 Tax=Streptomyces sp. NPDC023838 TaxID=3154325 RepID=UPI0033D1F6AF
MLNIRTAQRTAAAAVLAAVLAGTAQAKASAAVPAPRCDNVCVLDVRGGAHPDFDRVVFDLAGGQPNVQATESDSDAYVPPSGDAKHLQIRGKSYLFLNLTGASTRDMAGVRTYTNPDVQDLTLPSIRGVQLIPDYEGQVQFGLSLGDHSRYRVFALTTPDRLVVDIYH